MEHGLRGLWRLPAWSGVCRVGGRSSGLKLFGMSKCTARAQKNRPCKCLGMRALQSMRVSSPLESVFAKNLGGPPLHNNGRESENDAARHGKQARPRGQAGRALLPVGRGVPYGVERGELLVTSFI